MYKINIVDETIAKITESKTENDNITSTVANKRDKNLLDNDISQKQGYDGDPSSKNDGNLGDIASNYRSTSKKQHVLDKENQILPKAVNGGGDMDEMMKYGVEITQTISRTQKLDCIDCPISLQPRKSTLTTIQRKVEENNGKHEKGKKIDLKNVAYYQKNEEGVISGQFSWSKDMDEMLSKHIFEDNVNFEKISHIMKRFYPENEEELSATQCRARWCLLDSMNQAENKSKINM